MSVSVRCVHNGLHCRRGRAPRAQHQRRPEHMTPPPSDHPLLTSLVMFLNAEVKASRPGSPWSATITWVAQRSHQPSSRVGACRPKGRARFGRCRSHGMMSDPTVSPTCLLLRIWSRRVPRMRAGKGAVLGTAQAGGAARAPLLRLPPTPTGTAPGAQLRPSVVPQLTCWAVGNLRQHTQERGVHRVHRVDEEAGRLDPDEPGVVCRGPRRIGPGGAGQGDQEQRSEVRRDSRVHFLGSRANWAPEPHPPLDRTGPSR